MGCQPTMALSVAQPWAWALVHGTKRIENRRWRTRYRGNLVIHASTSRSWLAVFRENRRDQRLLRGVPRDRELDFGCLIGMVQLKAIFGLKDAQQIQSDFAEGPWCWYLTNPRPFVRPIPYRGELGLFPIDDEILQNCFKDDPS